jgi:hypothetical protein
VFLVLVAMAAALWSAGGASAEDSVRLSRPSSLLGEQVVMVLRVTAPQDATVELTPGTPTWAGVELVGVDSVSRAKSGDGVAWVFEARVSPFLPGEFDFAPTVAIIEGSDARAVTLPPVRFTARPTLAADAELVLTPLPEPRAIGGAQSPLLVPAIASGAAIAAAVVGLLGWLAVRRLRNALRGPAQREQPPALPPSLEGAQGLLHTDPVAAYRMMSAVVKAELARRYQVRATALTSTELRRKLEDGGDRWQARLVSGLLEECDSVIYAGYRPAGERREADLTMAREIVEADG